MITKKDQAIIDKDYEMHLITDAINVAGSFTLAAAALLRQHKNQEGKIIKSKLRATMKRRSLDLTNILTELRKPIK